MLNVVVQEVCKCLHSIMSAHVSNGELLGKRVSHPEAQSGWEVMAGKLRKLVRAHNHLINLQAIYDTIVKNDSAGLVEEGT